MKILITGAASGIGFQTGLKLAKLGHNVILTVHKEEQINNVYEKTKKIKNISCFKMDITNEVDRKKIQDLDIDCLINNAAIGIGGSVLNIPIFKLK